MDNERLNKLLAEGQIDQKTYDLLVAKNDQDEGDQDAPPVAEESAEDKDAELERRIQSAVDRATNKLGNEKKRLQEQLKELQQQKLTDEERRDLDLKAKEAEIAERESKLHDQECRLHAIKELKRHGLDDGSDSSLELVEFVLADDEEAITTKIKSFKALVTKMVAAEVDKTFKANGGKPAKSVGGAGENPYSRETFNLTKQMQLMQANPELARQYAAQVNKI